MTGLLLIYLVTFLTMTVGVFSVVTLVADASHSADVAKGIGRTSNGRDQSSFSILSLLRQTRFNKKLHRKMSAAGINWDVATTEISILFGALLAYYLALPFVGKIAAAVTAVLIPITFLQWVKRLSVQRSEKFISQLPELSRILSNCTSSGMSIERSLFVAARELSEPAKEEISRVTAQLSLGVSLDNTLHELSARMPSREINVLVRTIVIQSKAGGTLVAALQDIALALEDRKQLHREVRTVILGSAFSAYMVPLIGVASIVLLNTIKPGVLDDMASSFIGRLILLVSLIFFVVGAFIMRAVSKVEV